MGFLMGMIVMCDMDRNESEIRKERMRLLLLLLGFLGVAGNTCLMIHALCAFYLCFGGMVGVRVY